MVATRCDQHLVVLMMVVLLTMLSMSFAGTCCWIVVIGVMLAGGGETKLAMIRKDGGRSSCSSRPFVAAATLYSTATM